MASHEVISLNKKSLNIDLNIGQPAAAPPPLDPEPSPEPTPEPQKPSRDLFTPLPVYDDPKVKYSLILHVDEYFHSPVFGASIKHL